MNPTNSSWCLESDLTGCISIKFPLQVFPYVFAAHSHPFDLQGNNQTYRVCKISFKQSRSQHPPCVHLPTPSWPRPLSQFTHQLVPTSKAVQAPMSPVPPVLLWHGTSQAPVSSASSLTVAVGVRRPKPLYLAAHSIREQRLTPRASSLDTRPPQPQLLRQLPLRKILPSQQTRAPRTLPHPAASTGAR